MRVIEVLVPGGRISVFFGFHPRKAKGKRIISVALHDAISKGGQPPLSFGIIGDMFYKITRIQLNRLEGPGAVVLGLEFLSRGTQ